MSRRKPAKRKKKETGAGLLLSADPKSFEIEQFKALRTRVLFPESGKRPRLFAVTSTDFGDGKSFVAANLALTIARNIDGSQVLLMDCDMRLPSLHHLFDLGDVPGLSEYLSDDLPLAPLLTRPPIDNLTLLPAGRQPDNPAELLCSRKMSDLLEEVSTRYDDRYILMDLPPPQIVSEAGIIARQADGIIIVARYGRTSRDKVRELIEMFGKERIAGLVFNRFDSSMHSAIYRMYRRYADRKHRR